MEALESQIIQPQTCPFQSQVCLGSERLGKVIVNSWNPALYMPRCRTAKERCSVWQHWDTKGGWEHVLILSHAYELSRKSDCNTSSLEHSAGEQGHILHVKFPSWRPGRCPLGIWVCLHKGTLLLPFSMPGGATQALARRDAAKNLVKIIVFREVICGWVKSVLLVPFVDVVNGTALQ